MIHSSLLRWHNIPVLHYVSAGLSDAYLVYGALSQIDKKRSVVPMFGKRIKEIRKLNELSLIEFATKIGISPNI
ncbi:helix-turn-helix domain-containing protein [Paenibacillus sp. yr247]|uniref:helix-turn-helix domain-containing protein n=1 Tax=Paenibacillus sp. yr247 TaxID=1761880 RepID=UPI0015874607|nr:helix-turn-helix transcriptional regulator [Paenibacillus sp. yr247]